MTPSLSQLSQLSQLHRGMADFRRFLQTVAADRRLPATVVATLGLGAAISGISGCNPDPVVGEPAYVRGAGDGEAFTACASAPAVTCRLAPVNPTAWGKGENGFQGKSR